MPFKPEERQYRRIEAITPEVRDTKLIASDYYVEGYAMKYARSVLYEDEDGPVYEEFRPTAFDNTDMSDVIMQWIR